MVETALGPVAPPRHARTCRLETWGGGVGTFWQYGRCIGQIWDQLPDWGVASPPHCSLQWRLSSTSIARGYFDVMAGHLSCKEARHGSQTDIHL